MSYHNPPTVPRKSATFDDYTLSEIRRAANTGISAVFDPVGRVLGSQKLGTAGYIDTILPAPLPETVYGRFGDLVFFLLLACVTGLAIALKPDNCGA